MKKGFTMIELIFVIVILGILAAVAIPKLAATRDDAKAASIKTDIGTTMQAVPAWFQGQKEASFINAMSIDTNVWKKSTTTPSCEYVYSDAAGDKITMKIMPADYNSTNKLTTDKGTLVKCEESNATKLGNAPYLSIVLDNSNKGDIVDVLVSDMGVDKNVSITLAGKKVKW